MALRALGSVVRRVTVARAAFLDELSSLHRLLQRVDASMVPTYAAGAKVYLDYIDVGHRLKPVLQRIRPRESAAAHELVRLRETMVSLLHALPLLASSSPSLEGRYAGACLPPRTVALKKGAKTAHGRCMRSGALRGSCSAFLLPQSRFTRSGSARGSVSSSTV